MRRKGGIRRRWDGAGETRGNAMRGQREKHGNRQMPHRCGGRCGGGCGVRGGSCFGKCPPTLSRRRRCGNGCSLLRRLKFAHSGNAGNSRRVLRVRRQGDAERRGRSSPGCTGVGGHLPRSRTRVVVGVAAALARGAAAGPAARCAARAAATSSARRRSSASFAALADLGE